MHYSVPMTNNHFKTAATHLADAAEQAGYPLSAYAVLNITDALIKMGVNFAQPPSTADNHEALVGAALTSPKVIEAMNEGKKIQAIKELRTLRQCSLKAAKEAIEDYRVMAYYVRQPW